MKILISLLFLLTLNLAFSQTSQNLSDEENRVQDSTKYALKKQQFCEALSDDSDVKIKSPWSFYTFKVLSCKGNRGGQSAELIIIATQSSLNQRIKYNFNNTLVVDGLGKALKVSNGTGPSTIFTDTPVQISLTIQGVVPGTEKIGHIGLVMSSKDITISSWAAIYKYLELRNIPIKW